MTSLDCDLALDRVRGLARALDVAFARAVGLERDLDRALAVDLAPARGLASELDRALVRARELERALAVDFARSFARDLDLGLDLGLDFARDLAFDRARVRDRALVRLLAVALEGACGRVQQIVVGLEAEAAPGGPAPVRVAVCAGWLVRVALRVVPAGERSRYGEEWRGELWDLAGGSGRRRRQTVHAVRTLTRAWPVRTAVREGRRRPAGGG